MWQPTSNDVRDESRGHTRSDIWTMCGLRLAVLHQRRADFDALARLDREGRNRAVDARLQLVEHLHRLDDHEHGATRDRIAGRYAHFDDHAGKGRDQAPEAIDEAVCLVAAATAAAHRLDLLA